MKDERGFTLIELLAAIVLLSVLLIPLYSYLTQARGISVEAGIQSKAMTKSQSKIEQLLAEPWDSEYLTIGEHSESLTSPPFSKIIWNIQGNENGKLKQIEVTVEWGNLHGATEKYSIATLRTQR